jgi:CP family cyanate transporter-like MFS transporter
VSQEDAVSDPHAAIGRNGVLPLIDAEADDVPAPAPTPVRGRLGLWLIGAGIILVAFNLRTAVTSLGPVLHDAAAGTGLSTTATSVLTTVPSLCFGLFGPLAPGLARRVGTERALLIVLLLLTAGTALRGVPVAPALFAGQILACVSIGVVNVLLPGLVKRDFSGHVAVMTGLYTMAFCVGAALAAGVTVPLTQTLDGSWAKGLAFWALPAGLATLAWAFQKPAPVVGGRHAASRVRGLWTDALAWQLTLFMGMQSALAYIVFGWLVPMLRDRGLDPAQAGLVLSISVLAQAAASVVAPYIATRGRDQRLPNAIVSTLQLAGLMGCFYAPLPSIWVWSVLLGLAQGSTIALALTLIVLRAPDSHVAAHLSSMVQSVGYLICSAGPLLAGLIHGWTGGWNGVAGFCVLLAAILIPSGIGAGRALHVRAVATSQHG